MDHPRLETLKKMTCSFALPRDSDLEVTWTGGGTTGVVSVTIADAAPPTSDPVDPDANFEAVECELDPMAHKGTIPATALGFLRKGSGYRATDARSTRRGKWRILVGSSAGATLLPATIQ